MLDWQVTDNVPPPLLVQVAATTVIVSTGMTVGDVVGLVGVGVVVVGGVIGGHVETSNTVTPVWGKGLSGPQIFPWSSGPKPCVR